MMGNYHVRFVGGHGEKCFGNSPRAYPLTKQTRALLQGMRLNRARHGLLGWYGKSGVDS